MGSRHALAALALAGCGRFGFDVIDDATDAPGDAGSAALTTLLPPGGQLDKLAVAPDGAWYAVAVGGQAFRSDDNMTWVPCGTRALTGIAITSDGTVWGSGVDVSTSTDRCASWTPLAIGRQTDHVEAFGAELYALTDIGMRRRTGGTWTLISTPLDGNRFWMMDTAVGSPRLASTFKDGLVVSPDGIAWTAVTSGLPTLSVTGLATSPTKLYAITGADTTSNGGIACANAPGTTWAPCPSSAGGTAIAVDPTNDLHAVAAVYDNLFETTNGFATTTPNQRSGMGAANVSDLRYLASGALLAATNRGLFYSPPGPLAWEPRLAGLAAWTIASITRDGDDVFLASEGGVLRSIANAPYTNDVTGILFSTRTRSVVVGPAGLVYATGRSIWESADRGATWRILDALGAADSFFAYDAAFFGDRIYVGTGNRVLHADPPYATFTPTQVAGQDRTVFAILVAAAAVYVGTSSGVFRSVDQGVSYQPTTITAVCRAIVELADGGLAAGCSDGTWISDPSRSTWTRSGAPGIQTVAVVGDALVATTATLSRISRDRGATWIPIPGTANLDVRAALLDPSDGQLLIGGVGFGLARVPLP